MTLAEGERRRLLAWMEVDVYVPRRAEDAPEPHPAAAAPCILIRMDRPKDSLDAEQKTMLARLLKAMNWSGPVRHDQAGADRAVLEIAFGVSGSGAADVTVETDAIDRLAADEGRKRLLWSRLKTELPRLKALAP